ncbi:phosphonate C-P lyase system protein PhnH [Epibacterium ulvae]|uniref:phosphonate C-P lyase system protein PhnH n=1 Tax=Epibacterium ulvae TaxID=1156985 RepID=UPI001BFCA3B5|nr:phosphonate C-P lyase system protein PhnH [Epibacterium ulvae]MBT8152567.1 phosphonate C-P lyase system protein PhnH [Epibacterium ulvae]
MQPVPQPTADETRANASFAALLSALSRPGQIQTLPTSGEAGVIEALLDRECRVACADPRLLPQVMQTGALIAEIPQADHVFLGQMTTAAPLNDICIGSDLYPDAGATVVVNATFDNGVRLGLTGPGIDGETTVQIAGLPADFWQLRKQRIRYPMGFDLFLLDGARVMGLPRSTTLEVL